MSDPADKGFADLKRALDDLVAASRAQALGPERIFRFSHGDMPVALALPDAHYDLIQREILRTNGFFEANLLGKIAALVPRGGVMVDVGANIGNHTVFFAKVCGAAQVIAFEPQQRAFGTLLQNVALNGLSGVQCFRCGLGARRERARTQVFKPWNSGGLSLSVDPDGPFELAPLDDFHLARLDLIKIDVEGFQLDVLAGAGETLRRTRPLIVIEMREGEDDLDAIDRSLTDIGARFAEKLTGYERLYRF